MKLPICTIDARTGSLCAKCKKALRQGDITEIDIEISEELVSLAKTNKDLSSIKVYSCINLSDTILVLTKDKDIPILSTPSIKNKLENRVHRKIRFLQKTNDPKKIVEELIAPIPVITVTILFLPPFSEKEYKIEIDKKYKNQLPITKETIVKTVSSILDTEAYLEFV